MSKQRHLLNHYDSFCIPLLPGVIIPYTSRVGVSPILNPGVAIGVGVLIRLWFLWTFGFYISYSLFIFVLFLLSQQSRLSSYSIRYNIPLSIRRTDRLEWNQFHEFYEDYVSFYQHQTNGSCDTSYFLYSLPQEYYYINEGSASLKENEIRVFHKKYICSSPQILNRRFSKFLVSTLPVQLNQHNDW